MIPSNNTLLTTDLEIKTQPSNTYKMHTNHNAISGHCDGIEAVIQSIYKILNTERYQHIIYSWNYGFEFQDLLGKPVDYACVELQRRIQEALLQDDRITSVTDFKFDNSTKRTVKVTFVVHTIYGDVESERKVVI